MRDVSEVIFQERNPPNRRWVETVMHEGKLVPQTIIQCVCGKEYGLIRANGTPVDAPNWGMTGSVCGRCGKENWV